MLAAPAAARSSAPSHPPQTLGLPSCERRSARGDAGIRPARPRPQGRRSAQADWLHRQQEGRERRRAQSHEAPLSRACARAHPLSRPCGFRPRHDRPFERHRARVQRLASGFDERAREGAALIAKLLILIARGWQKGPSRVLPPSCRYQPSCSAYAITALQRYGAARGGWLALKRILRCHPWGGQGPDPVP